jgi:hypothetical protein
MNEKKCQSLRHQTQKLPAMHFKHFTKPPEYLPIRLKTSFFLLLHDYSLLPNAYDKAGIRDADPGGLIL